LKSQLNDLGKERIVESVLNPEVKSPKIESAMFTNKNDLVRNYETTKKIVNMP
jgi:hypothetical protein